MRVEVKDGQRVISRHEQQMTLEKEKDEKVVFPIKIESPHLWNGKRDPFMYQTETTLWSD